VDAHKKGGPGGEGGEWFYNGEEIQTLGPPHQKGASVFAKWADQENSTVQYGGRNKENR